MSRVYASDVYFGSYVRFDTVDSRSGAAIDGPNNAVGDIGSVVLELDSEKNYVAWLKNPYGDIIGYLDQNTSHKVELFNAKGWTITYVLSFCACTMEGSNIEYWGQVALIAYSPRYQEQFGQFLKLFAHRAGEGFRPAPQLSNEEVNAIIADPNSWSSTEKVKIPKGRKGTSILKDHRTNHDKMLDQARSRNKGCYILGYGFIAAIIAMVIFILNKLGII